MSLLKTLKGQILLVSIGCLVAGLLALTVANYLTARSQAYASLTAQSQALAHSHIETLRDWARGKAAVVESASAALEDAEAAKSLLMLAKAGNFLTTYFGYADKRTVFSEKQNLPPDYDPTGRPWYKQAAGSDISVLTAPYPDAGGAGSGGHLCQGGARRNQRQGGDGGGCVPRCCRRQCGVHQAHAR